MRAREAARVKAAENRIRFGQTKAEREAQAKELERQLKRLEDHALTERDKT